MNRYFVDLHVHTALSPCAAEEMTPPAIVRLACELGLHVLAICDHNSAGNVRAVQGAAGDRLTVLAGIEITTAEEVHVLGIFPDADRADRVARGILQTLPAPLDSPRSFGPQLLLDESGQVVGAEPHLLTWACGFDLTQTVYIIKEHGGLAIASHIDRPSFSVFSQLGIFPREAGFDAVEVTPAGLSSPDAGRYTALNLPIITASDSHDLATLGMVYSMFEIQSPTFEEVTRALKGEGNRKVYYRA